MSTVGDIIRWNARRYPNKLVIIFEEVRLTWKEANTRVNKLAHALIDRGMKKGDKVNIEFDVLGKYIQKIISDR